MLVGELGKKTRALPQLHLENNRQIAIRAERVQVQKRQPAESLCRIGSFFSSVRARVINASKAVLMTVIRISSLLLKYR